FGGIRSMISSMPTGSIDQISALAQSMEKMANMSLNNLSDEEKMQKIYDYVGLLPPNNNIQFLGGKRPVSNSIQNPFKEGSINQTEAVVTDTPTSDVFRLKGDNTWEYIKDNDSGKWSTRKIGNKKWLDISNNSKAVSTLENAYTGKTNGNKVVPKIEYQSFQNAFSDKEIKAIQSAAGLKQDGIFGVNTYNAMIKNGYNLTNPKVQEKLNNTTNNNNISTSSTNYYNSFEDYTIGTTSVQNQKNNNSTNNTKNTKNNEDYRKYLKQHGEELLNKYQNINQFGDYTKILNEANSQINKANDYSITFPKYKDETSGITKTTTNRISNNDFDKSLDKLQSNGKYTYIHPNLPPIRKSLDGKSFEINQGLFSTPLKFNTKSDLLKWYNTNI
ncbi:MAG: hypothetical protein KC414_06840, partial [Romboutsia sp.]|nr:hypothetical protein [Romboutsia sp.]